MMIMKVPPQVTLEYRSKGVILNAPAATLVAIIAELEQLAQAPNGTIAKFDRLTFRVSDKLSDLANKPLTITMPNSAWAFLVETLPEVLKGKQSNPLIFNECGFLIPSIPYDMGFYVTDIPETIG